LKAPNSKLDFNFRGRPCHRTDLEFVSLGPNGEWMLAVRNGRMWWGGLSDEGYEAGSHHHIIDFSYFTHLFRGAFESPFEFESKAIKA